jgi:hypothetical protein
VSRVEWKPIAGFHGCYAIDHDGRVLSLERDVTLVNRWGDPMLRRVPARILSPSRGIGGRQRVTLFKGGVPTCREIHHLVLETFTGPRPPGAFAKPVNGDYSDTRATNWRWAA